MSVEDDYATVDFATQEGSIRTGLLPLSVLEFAGRKYETKKADPKAGL